MMTEAEIVEWVMLLEHLSHSLETVLYVALAVKKNVKDPMWEYLSTSEWAVNREHYDKWIKANNPKL